MYLNIQKKIKQTYISCIMKYNKIFIALILSLFIIFPSFSARIKDISEISLEKETFLIGYGLVAGLKNKGDNTTSVGYTKQSIANMLSKLGINVPPNLIRSRNVAAVMVTATVKNYMKTGERFDVHVSSIGDARSLEGGVLLLSPLFGPDGKVYALAQGPVSLGGGFDRGTRGASISRNLNTSGIVFNGGILQTDISNDNKKPNSFRIYLRNPDYNTAQAIADSIKNRFNNNLQVDVLSAHSVRVGLKNKNLSLYKVIAQIENINIPVDYPAKVVINERTGTVVMNKNVKIDSAVISQGGITVKITQIPVVSQPQPFSQGNTVLSSISNVKVKEEKHIFMIQNEGADLKTLVDMLNNIGVKPRQLISILEALKEAGALHAQLKTY